MSSMTSPATLRMVASDAIDSRRPIDPHLVLNAADMIDDLQHKLDIAIDEAVTARQEADDLRDRRRRVG